MINHSQSCRVVGLLVPEAGKDYEVRYGIGERSCHLELSEIQSSDQTSIQSTIKSDALKSCSSTR